MSLSYSNKYLFKQLKGYNNTYYMSDCQVLDSKLFSRLPDAIIFEICVLTGKFKLRFDKRFNRITLISIIDLNDKLWVEFNKTLACHIDYKRFLYSRAEFGSRVTCSINRNGDLSTRMYLQITLPPITQQHFISHSWQDVREQQLIERATRLSNHSELPTITNQVIDEEPEIPSRRGWEQSQRISDGKKRRRGEKKRFKMQFK